VAVWKSERHLLDHHALHRAEFGGISIEEYDASAQDTLDVGTYFEFFDDRTGEWRTGCYHRETRRLTILDEDDLIVETLTNSTYG
jgi:hypothetical protein